MNYQKIHDKFIEYFKKTTPLERMVCRNPNDFRINEKNLYTEKHHIIPKSLEGSDSKDNLVDLLPEEHLFIHALRYKAFDTKEDFIAVRLIINGLNTNSKYNGVKYVINKKILSTYAWMKQHTSIFRYKHGWHTEDGRLRISESRKNTMPVKCALTGEIIGTVNIDHPKVVSGEWVHHSKGKHTYENIITGEKIYCDVGSEILNSSDWKSVSNDISGIKNPRYSGITDNEIVDFHRKVVNTIYQLYGIYHIPGLKTIKNIWDGCYETKFPNLVGGLRSGFRFGGDLYTNLYKILEIEYNITYSKYSKQTKKINITEIINAIN